MKTYQHFATVLSQLLGNDSAVRLTLGGYMSLSVEHIGQSADGNHLITFSCQMLVRYVGVRSTGERRRRQGHKTDLNWNDNT